MAAETKTRRRVAVSDVALLQRSVVQMWLPWAVLALQ